MYNNLNTQYAVHIWPLKSTKDNQMRSPLLLSGPKICKAYFEASNPKMLLHRLPLKLDFKGGGGSLK